MGLAIGGIAGVAMYMLLFAGIGWWAFALTPLVMLVMVCVIGLVDKAR